MIVHDVHVSIDADNDVIEMMVYCDTHGCSEKCPYLDMCEEFEFKYRTVPFGFCTKDGKPLTSL